MTVIAYIKYCISLYLGILNLPYYPTQTYQKMHTAVSFPTIFSFYIDVTKENLCNNCYATPANTFMCLLMIAASLFCPLNVFIMRLFNQK